MADIQSVSSAKFMHVASANKAGAKEGVVDAAQNASFFGVLKSQLGKLGAPADELVLELKAEGDEQRPLVQPEFDVAASAMPAPPPQTLFDADLISDPTREAAVLSSVVSVNAPPARDVVLPRHDGESEADLTQAVSETQIRPAVSSRQDVLRREGAAASAAANAAEARQALPLAAPSSSVDAALIPAAVVAEGKAEAALSPVLPAQTGPRFESGSVVPIALTHSFEQALRQAESRLNVSIEAPVRSSTFAAEVGDKVVWLAGRQGQLADFSLNPPQMGALEVRLTVSGGEATAQFFSSNPVVRDALDAAMPKLRELMAEAGLSLGETEVRDQAFSRREGPHMTAQPSAQDVEIGAHQGVLAGMGMSRSGGLGLVDLYI